MEKENLDIILKPRFVFWLFNNSLLIVLIVLITFLGYKFEFNNYIKFFCVLSGLILFSILFYTYVEMLLCTKWIVTEEQILIKRGVFFKTVNYIELYRVYDYERKQAFWQSFFNNFSVLVFSGDKSHPVLKMYGLSDNPNIIKIIRQRVEKQRKIKLIYEFTNK